MAITRQLAELILAEHKYRPISGEVLLLGRQMVFMTPDEARSTITKMGVPIRPNVEVSLDRTERGRSLNFISDTSFFALFTDANVRASDVSDYEGAEIIFDLSGELPKEVLGAFDFIYNGSVFDNVFDPASCMKNVSLMMRDGGVCFGYEGIAHFGLAYLKFGPDWFFDYYAINDFADGQFYWCAHDHFHRSAWTTYQWDAFVANGDELQWTSPMPAPAEVSVVVIAEKASTSTANRTPLQNLYRPDQRPYQAAFHRFRASPRRPAIAAQLEASAAVPPSLWKRLTERPKAKVLPGYTLIGMLGHDNPMQPF